MSLPPLSRKIGGALMAIAFAGVPAPPAFAHDAAVTSIGRVFLDELGEHRYALWTIDAGVPPFGDARSIVPTRCEPLLTEPASAIVGQRFTFECKSPLTIDDVITLPWGIAVVAVATWTDGSSASAYFKPAEGAVVVRLATLGAVIGSRAVVAKRFVMSGFRHVFRAGHLLLIVALLLIVESYRLVAGTIISFTLASMTSSAVTVLFDVQKSTAEPAFALGLVLLARDIVVSQRGSGHLIRRRVWLFASVLGLLCGLGFAEAIGTRLRADDIPAVLVSFNSGMALGQLALVEWVLLARKASSGASQPVWSPRARRALGYSFGVFAALWLFNALPRVF